MRDAFALHESRGLRQLRQQLLSQQTPMLRERRSVVSRRHQGFLQSVQRQRPRSSQPRRQRRRLRQPERPQMTDLSARQSGDSRVLQLLIGNLCWRSTPSLSIDSVKGATGERHLRQMRRHYDNAWLSRWSKTSSVSREGAELAYVRNGAVRKIRGRCRGVREHFDFQAVVGEHLHQHDPGSHLRLR